MFDLISLHVGTNEGEKERVLVIEKKRDEEAASL